MNLKDQVKRNIEENRKEKKRKEKEERVKKEKTEYEMLRKEWEDFINERLTSLILELSMKSTDGWIEVKKCVDGWIQTREEWYQTEKWPYCGTRENKLNSNLQLSNGYWIEENDIREFCKKNGFKIRYKYKNDYGDIKELKRYQGISYKYSLRDEEYKYIKVMNTYNLFFYSYLIKVA